MAIEGSLASHRGVAAIGRTTEKLHQGLLRYRHILPFTADIAAKMLRFVSFIFPVNYCRYRAIIRCFSRRGLMGCI